MFISILAGLSALSISIVAAYYSIVGLTAIFPATFLSVIIMGSVLEVGKIVTTVWLHSHWDKASTLLRLYLSIAVIILMTITSLGIFGFLSKSHLENSASSTEISYQIEEINTKIARKDADIKDNESIISQLDKSVSILTDAQRIRGKDGALAVRESQKEEREALNKNISTASDERQVLIQQKLALQSEVSKLEIEVGPIRYVAEMIYGANPDTTILEKAVRYLIILIVMVFDPLALVLLIAAISGLSIAKKEKVQNNILPLKAPTESSSPKPDKHEEATPDPNPTNITEDQPSQPPETEIVKEKVSKPEHIVNTGWLDGRN